MSATAPAPTAPPDLAVRPVLPIVLENAVVRLEPLAAHHRAALLAIGEDERVWGIVQLPAGGLPAYLDIAYAAAAPNVHVPFVVVRRSDEAVVGMSRMFDIRPEHGALEIGYTWYAPAAHGTLINPAAKRLLLGYAFDLGFERVQLKTDVRNKQSQAAMAKLGATREGVLRHQLRLPDGRFRDTVFFSILAAEWPAVRERLDARLAHADAGLTKA
jgi:RimJ/RimL family protein N-acetyltransferase